MAANRELYDLIYSDYQPILEGKAEREASQRLLNNRDLRLDELLEMYGEQVYLQFPADFQPYSSIYVCARIAYAALHSDSFTGEKAKYYMNFASYVQQNQPNYDPKREAHMLIGKVTSTMLRSENLSEMNELYEVMSWIESFNCIQNFETYKNMVEGRYIYIIGINQSQREFNSVKKHLEGMARLAELAVPYDFESQKVISASLGILTYREATTDQEKADIVQSMKKMNVQSESTRRMIDNLVVLQTAPQEHPQAPSRPFEDVPSADTSEEEMSFPEEPSRIWITDKSQLRLQEYPFHSNTNNSVHMHIYKGIFPYSETYQIPIAVKEYHAVSAEELKVFTETEYKILSFLSEKKEYFLICYGYYYFYSERYNKHIFGIVMECCEKTMMQYINELIENRTSLDEKALYNIVYTLLEGFAFMSKYKVYHYDIKPHNIFITGENKLKIADFNVSKIFDSELSMTTLPAFQSSLQGTDGYMPPEIQAYMDAKRMGEDSGPLRYRASKVDVYSLGLTFLQLHTLKLVYGFNRPQNQQALKKTLDSIDILWFKNLLENMLVFDFNQRKTIQQLVAYLPQIDTNLGTITTTIMES